MPDVNIASGEGGGGKYVIFTGYCLYVPRVLARVVGEGTVKPFHVNDSGQAAINILNGFHKVKTEPNGEKVFFQTENIQRKVMLYDCGNGAATVVDYMSKLTCYLFKENSKMTFGMGKCLGWIGRN